MEFECSFKRCNNEPARCCKCTEPWTLLCSDHFHSPPGDVHKMSSITNLFNPEYKSRILQNLLEQAKDIKAQRQTVLKFTEELISFVQKDTKALLDQLKILESNISSLIQQISTTRVIPDIEIPEFYILKQVANGNFPEGYNIKELFSVHGLLNKYEWQLNAEFDFNEPAKTPLMYAERNTNIGNIIDIDLKSIYYCSIAGIGPLGIFAASCLLPNNQIFYYGGYLKNQLNIQEYSNKCYIIDLESEKFIEKATGKPKNSLSSCAYFNNEVYVFGGYQNGCLTECQKFNIACNKWNQISPLPSVSYFVSSVEFNSKIYLSGSIIQNLLMYDPKKNNYFDILNLADSHTKVIFKSENILFLLKSQRVYWAKSNTWMSKYNQNILPQNSTLLCYPIIKKFSAYFLLGKADLSGEHQNYSDIVVARFNFRTKQLEIIMEIT